MRDRVLRGDVYARTVVVPEGYNIYDIAAVVEQAGLGTAADFIAVAKNDVLLLRDIDPQAQSLEGYLFPDTYQFTRIDTAHEIAAAMVHRFRQEAQKIGLLGRPDIHRIVTMASIVEKETAVPEERPLVASVYFNRLDRNMALGADPTVIYAALLAGRYRGTIYQSDLQFDSPYNTYKYPRIAAWADRQSGSCLAGGGHASGAKRFSVFRQRQQRPPPFLPQRWRNMTATWLHIAKP